MRESVLFFSLVDPRNGIQVIKLGRHLYLPTIYLIDSNMFILCCLEILVFEIWETLAYRS